eukprot:scaffold98802_cov70-Cyclotella_meneghiniana.AAC.8
MGLCGPPTYRPSIATNIPPGYKIGTSSLVPSMVPGDVFGGLAPETCHSPRITSRCDRVYPTTYPISLVPGGRYLNTYPTVHSKLGYHRWEARHFSLSGESVPRSDTRHPIPRCGDTRVSTRAEHGLGQRAIPGYLPEESNYSGSKP